MKEKVLENYNKWNEQCRKEYDSLFPNAQYTIWDGVVYPELYATSPLKIMFLNREPYDEEFTEYNLADALRTELSTGRKPIFASQTKLRQRLKEYLCVVNLIKNNELMSISQDELVRRVQEISSSDTIFKEMFPSVAYINVKKSNGINKSYVPDLREYAIQGQSILAKQIEFFNPSIILSGNVIGGVLTHTDLDWGENLYSPKGKAKVRVFQLKINDVLYPIVDMYHPSSTQGYMTTYYLDLLHALREVDRKYPDYWGKRLNLQCYNN